MKPMAISLVGRGGTPRTPPLRAWLADYFGSLTAAIPHRSPMRLLALALLLATAGTRRASANTSPAGTAVPIGIEALQGGEVKKEDGSADILHPCENTMNFIQIIGNGYR